MAVKDYYTILEIAPGATLVEIKKNFRRLALKYHPDTNPGNNAAAAWFREIQEAYEILGNDQLREAYHQERWLLKAHGKPFMQTIPLVPEFILSQCKALAEEVKLLDHFRMDQQALQKKILFLLRPECEDALIAFNDQKINRQLAQAILQCCEYLPITLFPPIFHILERIAATDQRLIDILEQYQSGKKSSQNWEKYQWLFILILSILLCVCIYYYAGQ